MQSPQSAAIGSLPRNMAEQALQLQKAPAAPVNLAPFSIQRSMSGQQDRGAHAAAERMQKVRLGCSILGPWYGMKTCLRMQDCTCQAAALPQLLPHMHACTP